MNQELYDIETGLESVNIASDPSSKEIMKNLSKKIKIKNQSLLLKKYYLLFLCLFLDVSPIHLQIYL